MGEKDSELHKVLATPRYVGLLGALVVGRKNNESIYEI